MSAYTQVLEFFMENGITLNSNQMEDLKNICEASKDTDRKKILSKVISICTTEISKIKKKYSNEECLKYVGFGIYNMKTLQELNNYNSCIDEFMNGTNTINIGSCGENEDYDHNITKNHVDKSFKILDEAITNINKKIVSYGKVDYEGTSELQQFILKSINNNSPRIISQGNYCF